MYAFGMHSCVCSAKGGLVTCDLCVVGSFTCQMPWGLQNGRPVERTKEYVGYIEEILGLDYQNHCTTVLVYDWIRSSHNPRYPNIQRARYDFMHRGQLQPHGWQCAFQLVCIPIALPTSIILQWSNKAKLEDCVLDNSCKHGQTKANQSVPSVIEVGNDGDFVGLQPRVQDAEPIKDPRRTAMCTSHKEQMIVG